MALRLYHDADATQEITEETPDTVHMAVAVGQTLVDERPIYVLSDDPGLTYEAVSIEAEGDTDDASERGQVDVLYAPDNNGTPGTYVQTLTLPDRDYATPHKIWRKVTSPNVQQAFNVTTIQHVLQWHEYAK